MNLTHLSEQHLATVRYLAEFAVRPSFRTPVHIKPEDRGIEHYEDVFSPHLMECHLRVGYSVLLDQINSS